MEEKSRRTRRKKEEQTKKSKRRKLGLASLRFFSDLIRVGEYVVGFFEDLLP